MAAINERDVSRMLFNPWAVYVSTVGDSQPAVPSFYTDRGIGINPITEFVGAEAYNVCSGISYTVRQDPIRFNLKCTWSIKEFVAVTCQLVFGGTIDSTGNLLTFDGVAPPYKAVWLQTCYNDDEKIVRLTMPKGRSVDTAAVSSGDVHMMLPTTWEALPEIDDADTLPSLYFEA